MIVNSGKNTLDYSLESSLGEEKIDCSRFLFFNSFV